MMSTLFFPIIPSIIQMTIFIFGFAVIVYLNSFGKPSYIVKMYSSTCDCTGPAASYHVWDAFAFKLHLIKLNY